VWGGVGIGKGVLYGGGTRLKPRRRVFFPRSGGKKKNIGALISPCVFVGFRGGVLSHGKQRGRHAVKKGGGGGTPSFARRGGPPKLGLVRGGGKLGGGGINPLQSHVQGRGTGTK